MTAQTPSKIHKSVREHYGKIAEESGSCCSPTNKQIKQKDLLYPQEMIADLPNDIASFTAGSGDPITEANLQPGESVLDLGSGGGLDCFLAAKQVGEAGHVIGVDMTPEMLTKARVNAERLDLANVEFREGYLENLPVDDASIDVVISNCVINLSPDKQQVFQEIYRALRPGGRIAVSDIVTNKPVSEEQASNEKDWCGCVAGALDRKEYFQQLNQAGFIDIQIEPDVKLIEKALDSGQAEVRSNQEITKSELLAQIKDWEKIENNVFVPCLISARKPV